MGNTVYETTVVPKFKNGVKNAAGDDLPLTKGSALTAQVAAAPAGGTGATAGAYDSASNRDIMIACVNRNRTRIAELEAVLQAAGLLA